MMWYSGNGDALFHTMTCDEDAENLDDDGDFDSDIFENEEDSLVDSEDDDTSIISSTSTSSDGEVSTIEE
jgi:hypothetical protein